jgi:hypothetical protein
MEKRLIKIIKKANRESPEVRSAPDLVVGPNLWTRAVKLWVVEFKRNAQSESAPAFDRLFQPSDQ